MNKLKNNQSGFGAFEGLLILIIIVLVGVVGYMVYKNHAKSVSSVTKATTTKSPVTRINTSASAVITQLPTDWTWYENKDLGFKFAYPNSWKVIDSGSSVCAANASDFGASSCPLSLKIIPQSEIDSQTKKHAGIVDYVLYCDVLQKSDKSLASVYDLYKLQDVSESGYTPKPSQLTKINGLEEFYFNQKTSQYSDNNFVFQLGSGTYINFTNRESGAINDFTVFTPVVNQIVNTVEAI